MKNLKDSRTGRLFRNTFKVRSWVDWERTKNSTHYLVNGMKRMLVLGRSDAIESFEAVQARLNLSEHDLQVRKKGLLRLSILMLIFAMAFFSYATYHLFQGHFKALVLSYALTLVSLALAFRYHFWYFQIKQRKLGVSLNEWFTKGLLGNDQ